MNIGEIDIHELLPQQEPFVMIDRLTFFDEKNTSTEFTIRKDNIFVENGQLDACALAENMAQTCAARLGYVNKYILKRGIQLGFIGAIKAMKIMAVPKVGDTLHTSLEVIEQIMDLTLVNATVKIGELIVSTAEMKIALADGVESK